MADPKHDAPNSGPTPDADRPSELAPIPPAHDAGMAAPGAPTTAPTVTESPGVPPYAGGPTAPDDHATAYPRSAADPAGRTPPPNQASWDADSSGSRPWVASGPTWSDPPVTDVNPGSWDEDEARKRLNLDRDRPQPGDRERLDYDRLVTTTTAALEALGNLAFHRLVALYANHRTRYLVSDEAQKLDLDPDGVHAVLATLPGPDRSEWY